MTRVLDEAVEALARRVFFDRLNQRYGELLQDVRERSEMDAERRVEDGALRDAST